MTLNIFSSLDRFGLAGTAGSPGTNGTADLRNGGPGGAGSAGQKITQTVPTEIFTGDAGSDVVNISRSSFGGSGGWGGSGGVGAGAVGTVLRSNGPGFSRTDIIYDIAGNGGAAGKAGAAGAAGATFSKLMFNLAGGTTAQDSVTLGGSARGGIGGYGGSGGYGGAGAETVDFSYSSSNPPNSFFNQFGTPGGNGPNGAVGGNGGSATSSNIGTSVMADNLTLSISGSAVGGNAGAGGLGGASGRGSSAVASGSGGDGGIGGAGTATVSSLKVTVNNGLSLSITLDAQGGLGGNGGAGGYADFGQLRKATYLDGVGTQLIERVYGTAGAGGDGGKGGAGTASVTGAVITGSVHVDTLSFTLSAKGGTGGLGTQGGTGAASSSTISGDTTTSITGTPDGAHGLNGAGGAARVIFTGNTISLGDGNDTLTLSFIASGPGAKSVKMSGNSFDGGVGSGDTLALGRQAAGETGFIVDVQNSTLRIGTGPTNAMTGFEIFRGGSGNDRFLDGAGSQTYSRGFGADRFEFTLGLAGNDRIEGFETADVIRLAGFGAALDSFADLLAATTDTAAGAVIQTSATSSILLAGMTVAALQADDFLFT